MSHASSLNPDYVDEAGRPIYHPVEEPHHPEGHSTMLGFWMYLMSDCLIFAMLFAVYAVIGGNYAAGPSPKDLFDLPLVALNTSMLLLSSITYGFAMLAMVKNRTAQMQTWLAITGVASAMAGASSSNARVRGTESAIPTCMVSSWLAWRSVCSSSAPSEKMAPACSSAWRPAAVKTSRLPSRLNSATPRDSSSSAT